MRELDGLGLRDDFLPSETDFSLISSSLLFILYKALILLGLTCFVALSSLGRFLALCALPSYGEENKFSSETWFATLS